MPYLMLPWKGVASIGRIWALGAYLAILSLEHVACVHVVILMFIPFQGICISIYP